MSRTAILNTLLKIRDGYFGLQINQRLYFNAIAVLMVSLASSIVLGFQGARSFFWLFLVVWGAAIIYDLLAIYKKIYETILGKTFLIILLSLCTNFAFALSSQFVNEITGVDPSKFPRTIALLSILCIPIFISAVCGILYFLLLLVSPLLFWFHLLQDDKLKEVLIPGYSVCQSFPYPKTTRVLQLISFALFCGLVFSFSQRITKQYESFLLDTACSFLYQMEMYRKAPYDIKAGSRVAFLSDDKLLIGEKTSNGIVFKMREFKDETKSALH